MSDRRKRSNNAAYRQQAKQKAQQEKELRSKLQKLDNFFKLQVLQRKIESNFDKTGQGKSSNLNFCVVWRISN